MNNFTSNSDFLRTCTYKRRVLVAAPPEKFQPQMEFSYYFPSSYNTVIRDFSDFFRSRRCQGNK